MERIFCGINEDIATNARIFLYLIRAFVAVFIRLSAFKFVLNREWRAIVRPVFCSHPDFLALKFLRDIGRIDLVARHVKRLVRFAADGLRPFVRKLHAVQDFGYKFVV